jgi:hypothetical protein
MVSNYRGQVVSGKWRPRNCILGDEMGLGKTAQSIAVISWLKQYAGASAPCMVVAPLTTLGHWKREIETWTDLVRGQNYLSYSVRFCLDPMFGGAFILLYATTLTEQCQGNLTGGQGMTCGSARLC